MKIFQPFLNATHVKAVANPTGRGPRFGAADVDRPPRGEAEAKKDRSMTQTDFDARSA